MTEWIYATTDLVTENECTPYFVCVFGLCILIY